VLKQDLGVDAEMQVGPSGRFFVQVNGDTVIEKEGMDFPPESAIVDAVRAKLK
jgi:hypothetical protein